MVHIKDTIKVETLIIKTTNIQKFAMPTNKINFNEYSHKHNVRLINVKNHNRRMLCFLSLLAINRIAHIIIIGKNEIIIEIISFGEGDDDRYQASLIK
ncbi:MAG: hypothetical protein D3913_16975 [Candidatus Electrothrix sp. LOE1_4_5]|nr:hypothetical protein [Candidatus Electrothrix gigas]